MTLIFTPDWQYFRRRSRACFCFRKGLPYKWGQFFLLGLDKDQLAKQAENASRIASEKILTFKGESGRIYEYKNKGFSYCKYCVALILGFLSNLKEEIEHDFEGIPLCVTLPPFKCSGVLWKGWAIADPAFVLQIRQAARHFKI